MYVWLNDCITKNNLLSQQQYDFRSNHSTSLVITDFYENLLQNLDKKLLSCAVLLDQRNVFDSVNHCTLSRKLDNITAYEETRNSTSKGETLESRYRSLDDACFSSGTAFWKGTGGLANWVAITTHKNGTETNANVTEEFLSWTFLENLILYQVLWKKIPRNNWT